LRPRAAGSRWRPIQFRSFRYRFRFVSFSCRGEGSVPRPSDPTQLIDWVEQDSNLRRQCHQIYSLAPLAAWVSTRIGSKPVPRLRRGGFVALSPGSRRPFRLVREVVLARHGRAGGESLTHNRRFTKPVLCRLSYASVHEAVKFPNIPPETFHARGLFTSTFENRLLPGSIRGHASHPPGSSFNEVGARERTRPRANEGGNLDRARPGGRGREGRRPSRRTQRDPS
jgi:hypothetical protein